MIPKEKDIKLLSPLNLAFAAKEGNLQSLHICVPLCTSLHLYTTIWPSSPRSHRGFEPPTSSQRPVLKTVTSRGTQDGISQSGFQTIKSSQRPVNKQSLIAKSQRLQRSINDLRQSRELTPRQYKSCRSNRDTKLLVSLDPSRYLSNCWHLLIHLDAFLASFVMSTILVTLYFHFSQLSPHTDHSAVDNVIKDQRFCPPAPWFLVH